MSHKEAKKQVHVERVSYLNCNFSVFGAGNWKQSAKTLKWLIVSFAAIAVLSACGERKKQGGSVQVRPTTDRGAVGPGGVPGVPGAGQGQSTFQDPLPNKGWGYIYSNGDQGSAWQMLAHFMGATYGGDFGNMRSQELPIEGYLKADVQIRSGNGIVNLTQAIDMLTSSLGMQLNLSPQGSLVLAINDDMTDQAGNFLDAVSVALTPSSQGQIVSNSNLFSASDGIGAYIIFQDNVGSVTLTGYFKQNNGVIYYQGNISYDNGQNNYTNTQGLVMSGNIGGFAIEACRMFACN